jgi:hypothetical protein
VFLAGDGTGEGLAVGAIVGIEPDSPEVGDGIGEGELVCGSTSAITGVAVT